MDYNNLLIENPYLEQRGIMNHLDHADSPELWEKNTQQIGRGWYYSKCSIEYNFNELGYRMMPMSNINWNNYIVFFGCSYTVGVGLALEQTFAYRVSNTLNCDYINASIGGSSPDFVVNNFVHFMSRVEKFPQAVIINWPSIERTFYWNDFYFPHFKIPNDITTSSLFKRREQWNQSYGEFVQNSDHIDRRMQFLRETVQLICKTNSITLCECSSYQTEESTWHSMRDISAAILVHEQHVRDDLSLKSQWDILHRRWARDIKLYDDGWIVAHPGFDHQDWMTEHILSTLSK